MVAQESAVGVQESAKASEELNRLTENLQQIVDQFHIDENRISQNYESESSPGHYLNN
jgi:Holliday junction resolvasome RuvABC endonuclease subunit